MKGAHGTAAIESEIVASWMQVVELQTDSCTS